MIAADRWPRSRDRRRRAARRWLRGDGARDRARRRRLAARSEPGGLFVAVPGEHIDGHEYAAAAVGRRRRRRARSPGRSPVPHVLVDDTVAGARPARPRVVDRLAADSAGGRGLTGSVGKTSTKDLLAPVLEPTAPTVAPVGSFNNEIGVPLTVLVADESAPATSWSRWAPAGSGTSRTCARSRRRASGWCSTSAPPTRGSSAVARRPPGAKSELVEALPRPPTAGWRCSTPTTRWSPRWPAARRRGW